MITPIITRFVLTTGHDRQGAPRYYTGRGGERWVGGRSEAFTFAETEAKRKAELLNRMSEVHGLTFWVEAA